LHNGVATFMTAGKFDLVVWAPEIPYSIAAFAGSVLLGGVSYNQMFNTGLPRPGAFWLNYTESRDRESALEPGPRSWMTRFDPQRVVRTCRSFIRIVVLASILSPGSFSKP
jgi:hypothetical protein